ncbi:MAG: sugar-binding protein [Byssovorax sp.]
MLVPPRRARAAFAAVALGFLVAPAAAGCIFFSSFDGLTDGVDDAGPPDGGSDAACGQVKVPLCKSIPSAPGGFAQVVDGDAAEFCAIPFTTFDPSGGQYRTCPRPAWLDDAEPRAAVRAAWSAAAIHVHVRVDKATAVAPNDAGELYKGDAVELFFANVEAPTGALDADHSVTIIVAPPLTVGGPGTLSASKAFTGAWTTRLDATGYDVELTLPWSLLGGALPAANRTIVWNFGIDVAAPSGPRFQSFLRYELPDAGPVWCDDNASPKPSSNDQSWCQATLSP